MKTTRTIALIFVLVIAMIATTFAISSCGENDDPVVTTPDQTRITLGPLVTTTTNIPVATTTADPGVQTTTTNIPVTTTTSAPIVNPPTGNYTNPLTGVPTVNDLSNQKPIAVVVDNISFAYPHQTGLGQADILYEGLVAPGITRFLAVISDYANMKTISNVRSARDYHIYSATNHNAVLFAHSVAIVKAPYTNQYVISIAEKIYGNYINSQGLVYYGFVNTMTETGIFGADNRYQTNVENTTGRPDLKYETTLNAKAVNAVLTNGHVKYVPGYTTQGKVTAPFTFETYGQTSSVLASGVKAENILVTYTLDNEAGAKLVEYTYKDGKYYRAQDGKAHTDSVTGEQLSFTNIITLNCKVSNYAGTSEDPKLADIRCIGTGSGLYISGGKMVNISWVKASETAPLVLKDSQGNILKITAGNTIISYVNQADQNSVRVLG